MQRLTARLTSRIRRRLAGERGGAAVLISLLLVPLLGFAAIAVDIGSLYAEKARLQIAADAAALAVARDCARGNCGDMQATARNLVDANIGGATAAPPVLGTAPLSVTVTGRKPQQHWFAPVIGHDATAVSATATVAWGAPGGGTAALPLIFSWCEFAAQTGGGIPSSTSEWTIRLPKSSGTGCTGPSDMFVPGGFGWLTTTGASTCKALSRVGGWFGSETGNNPSKGCNPGDLDVLLGKTVLLPIFDQATGTGSGAQYHVYAYAAFTITDYYFSGQYKGKNKPCSGDDRCIRGYFTRFVQPDDAFFYDSSAPNLGAWVLRLIR
jgi:Flp pilus assembly protein TadG